MKWDILIYYNMIKRTKLNKIIASICIAATIYVAGVLVYLECQKGPCTEDAAWFSIGLGVVVAPILCIFIELFNSNR